MFVMITANALNEPVIDFIEMSYGIVLSRGYTIDNPIPLVVAEKINDYPFLLGHWEISNSSHGFRLNGSKGIEVYDLSTAQGQTGYPIRKAAEEAALQLEGRK
jgi:hypothetical protein